MPVFEENEIQVCETCRMSLANGDLPNDFPAYVAWANVEEDDEETDPDKIDPNEVDWHPDHIHGDGGTYPSALGWALSVEDGQTDEFSAYNCEACNGGPGPRYPVTAMRPALKVEVHYSGDVWNEAGNLVNPWNEDKAEFEANPRAFSQRVTLICRNAKRADDDQTVLGSSWECPRDMEGFAYTVVQENEADQICKALRAEGYDVTEGPSTVPLHS